MSGFGTEVSAGEGRASTPRDAREPRRRHVAEESAPHGFEGRPPGLDGLDRVLAHIGFGWNRRGRERVGISRREVVTVEPLPGCNRRPKSRVQLGRFPSQLADRADRHAATPGRNQVGFQGLLGALLGEEGGVRKLPAVQLLLSPGKIARGLPEPPAGVGLRVLHRGYTTTASWSAPRMNGFSCSCISRNSSGV